MKCHNILVVHQLTLEQDQEHGMPPRTIQLVAELCIRLESHCSITGQHFRTVEYISSGSAYSEDRAVYIAVQRFLDAEVHVHVITFKADMKSNPHSGVDEVRVNVQEPLKSLFLTLFDPAQWKVAPKSIEE